MQFTGTSLILKRSIYPQTGNYSIEMSCTVDNTSGIYNFGLSGNGRQIDFVMKSGKIYFDEKVLHSYVSNQEFLISADFSNNTTNVRKNQIPLLYGYPKQTGNFDTFYFKRENINLGATFNLFMSGDNIPNYSISNNGFLVYSGQSAVTGYFINNSSFPIRIFNSSIQSSQPYSFGKIIGYTNGQSTGLFSYSGNFDSIDFSQPIFTTFNTSFGNTDILFKITDLRAMNGFILLQDIANFDFDSGTNLNRDISYTNYSGGFATNSFNTSLTFILDYVSGSGNFIDYQKTFTGTWSMQTGVDSTSLFQMPIIINQNKTRISGGGIFEPNSLVNFQLNHIVSGINTDVATLTISGELVYNPITATITAIN